MVPGWVRAGNRRRYHFFAWFVPGLGFNSLCGMKWVKDQVGAQVRISAEKGVCKKCYELARIW